MLGNYSYLVSLLIFTGIPVVVEFVFFFQILKKYLNLMVKIVTIFLIATPFVEYVAITSNAWRFADNRSLGIFVFGAYLETMLVTVFISLAVSGAIVIGSFYTDLGKPTASTSLVDIFSGKYAIWKRNKHRKDPFS